MRNLLLTIVPAIAIMAAPAFAQSSVSSSETTTTTNGAAPDATMTKEVHKSQATPGGEQNFDAKSERTVSPDGSSQATTERHAETNGVDGSHSESSSTTTNTGPN